MWDSVYVWIRISKIRRDEGQIRSYLLTREDSCLCQHNSRVFGKEKNKGEIVHRRLLFGYGNQGRDSPALNSTILILTWAVLQWKTIRADITVIGTLVNLSLEHPGFKCSLVIRSSGLRQPCANSINTSWHSQIITYLESKLS